MHKKIIALTATAALTIGLLTTGVYAATTSTNNTDTTSSQTSVLNQNSDMGGKGSHGVRHNGMGKDGFGFMMNMSSDEFTKYITDNTSLTQTEKDQLTAVYNEITPLREQLNTLREQEKTADDTTKATLKTQIEDLMKQIKDKQDTVKDILAKIQPQKTEGDRFGGKGMFGANLDKIISDNTTLTQAEKDQLSAVNTEIKPLNEQISTLREQEKTADDTTKATLKTQIQDLEKQVKDKLDTVKDILAKVQPQKPEGGKGMFGANLDKIISDNTTLTQAEKDQLSAVNNEIKPLQEQIKTLFEQEKTADDTTKATLKTQIEDLNKQIKDKLDTVKDILSKIQPQKSEHKGNSNSQTTDSTTEN